MTRASTRCVACEKRMQVSRVAPSEWCIACLIEPIDEAKARRLDKPKRARQGAGR